MGRSVGNRLFLFFQIPYPLNLIVKSPTIGNKIKYTINLLTKNFFKDITVYIGQFSKFAMKCKRKQFLTENVISLCRTFFRVSLVRGPETNKILI